jgi:hypothetical protein
MSEAKVFVYCDNHNRRAPVTDFVRDADGKWTEVGRDSSVRVATGAKSGLGMVRIGPDNGGSPGNYRLYDLRCTNRRCQRNVAVREDMLFAALDGFMAAGMPSVPLSLLAASLKHV